MKLVLLLAALGSIAAAPNKVSIPNFVKLCTRDTSNFDDCLLDSLQKLAPYLARGIREMDIPPMDPFYISESNYEFRSGEIMGQLILKDCYTYGMENMQFRGVRSNFNDPNKIELEVDFFVPSARTEGKYKQHGRFNVFQFNGRGLFNITTENVDVNWKITGSLYEKDGEKYLKVDSFIVTPQPAELKVDASNLVAGNESMTRTLLSLINQYWRLTYDGMLPYSQEVWDKLFRQIANRLFSKVPFDNVFPKSQ